jgi:hypothetical protein
MRTITFTVGTPTAPNWFSALGHKQWAQPVSNTIQAVADPLMYTTNRGNGAGAASVVTAWVGAVCDQSLKTVALLGNGGHDDYWGNEVYSVDLSATTPAWTRRRNATVCGPRDPITNPQWSDGRPCSDHTGDYCVAADGKWFKCGLGSTNYNGDVKEGYWWTFSPTTNDYSFLGSAYTINPDFYGISSSTVWDSSRGRIIKVMASPSSAIGIRMYSVTTGAQVDSVSQVITAGAVSASIDTTNDVLLIRVKDSDACYSVNLATKAVATFSSTGTRPTDGTAKIYWHAPSNAFVTWDGAQGLKKLTPTYSGGNYTGAVWSSVAGAGGVTVPSSMVSALGGGMYSKVQLINDMGNGDAALVIVPRWSAVSDVWVMSLIGAV